MAQAGKKGKKSNKHRTEGLVPICQRQRVILKWRKKRLRGIICLLFSGTCMFAGVVLIIAGLLIDEPLGLLIAGSVLLICGMMGLILGIYNTVRAQRRLRHAIWDQEARAEAQGLDQQKNLSPLSIITERRVMITAVAAVYGLKTNNAVAPCPAPAVYDDSANVRRASPTLKSPQGSTASLTLSQGGGSGGGLGKRTSRATVDRPPSGGKGGGDTEISNLIELKSASKTRINQSSGDDGDSPRSRSRDYRVSPLAQHGATIPADWEPDIAPHHKSSSNVTLTPIQHISPVKATRPNNGSPQPHVT